MRIPRSKMKIAVVVAALAALASCGDQAPVAPIGADPKDLIVGVPLYVCGHWTPDTSVVLPDTLTADVHFRPDTSLQGPTDGEVALFTGRGATIVHRFHFPAVRITMSSARLRAMLDSVYVNAVTSVPAPARFDWTFVIMLQRAVTIADTQYITRLGGLLRGTFRSMPGMVADLPDESLPYLRAWPGVRYIDNSIYGCAYGLPPLP